MDIEQAIVHLEEGIRRLKVQYDIFFAGGMPRPPTELKDQLDRLIKRFTNAPIRKYAHRFHFNTLVGRYNAMSELWNKQVRAREEGREIAAGASDPHARNNVVKRTGINGDYVVRISDPQEQADGLRKLFDQYVEARRDRDGSAPRLSLNSFIDQMSRQIESLKDSSGCSAVEFRVTKGAPQVTIKARPTTEEARH